ncbi:hypothetical protein [Glycomyces sp. NPDC048151]|uniref:hypothetical protein n=1 Tax=Glycomyces sp. NPDC048151 TaxID=3364002 RepID=UPI0037205248
MTAPYSEADPDTEIAPEAGPPPDVPSQYQPPDGARSEPSGGWRPEFQYTATMNLAAAAYVGRRFRDRVLDDVYHRPGRAVAPNPGIEPALVMRHVFRAHAINLAEFGILFCGFVVLVLSGTGVLLALLFLAVWTCLGAPVSALEARALTSTAGSRPPRYLHPGLVVGLVATVGGFMAAVAILVVPQLTRIYLDTPFGASVYLAKDPRADITTAAVTLTVLGIACATCGFLRAKGLNAIPTETVSGTPRDERLAYIAEAQDDTVVVYNASRGPFIGAGQAVETWEVAIALRPADRGEDGKAGMTVDPIGLNRFVRDRLEQLASDTATTTSVPNLELRDQILVSGLAVPGPIRQPHEFAAAGYGYQTIEEFQRDPRTPARHYLRCKMDSWGGELVATVYVHCALEGESLYVECSSHLLMPTAARYQVFGERPMPGAALFLSAVQGFASMPGRLVRSPYHLLRSIGLEMRNAWRKTRLFNAAPVDYGALVGIRELGTGGHWNDYFQYRDQIKYIGILEKQILDTVGAYLRENNVDLSEFEQRVFAIVNNGVMNYGKLNAGAAGAGSSANVGSVGDASSGAVA